MQLCVYRACVLVCESQCYLLISSFNFVNHFLNAGVHDSYWTHACDVDEMNRILREKFVELYEAPILENVKFFRSHKLLKFR